MDNKRNVWIVVAFVAILVILGAVFVVGRKDDKKNSTTNTSATTPSTNTEDTPSSEQPTVNNDVTTSVSVEIKDFAFSPATLTVSKGTTVVWTNKDSVGHTVTPDQASDNFEASELLGQGESYQFTFDTPGTYTYHCQPHPNMKAKVVVTE